MAMTKAAGLINTRALLREKGEAAEKAVLAQLTPQEVTAYQNALPVTQMPIEFLSKVAELSAPVLFPGQNQSEAYKTLGRVSALRDLKGIYQILLRFTTPEFAIKQAARLWTTLHSQGQARCFPDGDKRIVFEVTGYPDLPGPMRQVLGGYILGIAEMTGLKRARIIQEDGDPHQWRWITVWD